MEFVLETQIFVGGQQAHGFDEHAHGQDNEASRDVFFGQRPSSVDEEICLLFVNQPHLQFGSILRSVGAVYDRAARRKVPYRYCAGQQDPKPEDVYISQREMRVSGKEWLKMIMVAVALLL